MKYNRKHRATKDTALILCEGEVLEYNYFLAMSRERELCKYKVSVKTFRGGGPARALELAKRSGRDYDLCACVIDSDVLTKSRPDQVDELIAKFRRCNTKLFWSNPSFEVWLLAHTNLRIERPSDTAALKSLLRSHCEENNLEDDDHWKTSRALLMDGVPFRRLNELTDDTRKLNSGLPNNPGSQIGDLLKIILRLG